MQLKYKKGLDMYIDEIIEEIALTLDKLIENASYMQNITHIEEKILDFQKTQKNLLEHLHSMTAFLEKSKKTLKMPKEKQAIISKKLAAFEKLNSAFIKNVSKNARLIKTKKKERS